jgi:hypothetical protein
MEDIDDKPFRRKILVQNEGEVTVIVDQQYLESVDDTHCCPKRAHVKVTISARQSMTLHALSS